MNRQAKIFFLTLLGFGTAQLILCAGLPVITNQPASLTFWSGNNVTFVVGVSNAGAFTYQWQHDNTNLPNGIITTVAGNGTGGFAGDGGAATGAELNSPSDVAVDRSGNLFIADNGNNRIRKVDADNIITTVAGGSAASFSGDGSAATNASLNQPTSVSVDDYGNLFIADTFNNVIRRVDTNGIITTVAGSYSSPGYSGDGVAATNTGLAFPFGVMVNDSGNLLIADSYDNLIRKVDTNGIITSIAGNNSYGYSGDNGAATSASLALPSGVTLDEAGNLFIADSYNNVIRKVDTNGIITTVAGNGAANYSGDGGAATNASLNQPSAVLVDAGGNLFIADTVNNVIRELTTNGIITTVAGNGTNTYAGDGGPATNAAMRTPYGLAFDSAGNLFIADEGNNRIREILNTRGPMLTLHNVSATDEGSYRVVVTGPDGSVTSSVASLIPKLPQVTQTVRHSDGSMELSFLSRPGSTNVVLSATNLLPPVVWQSLSTNQADINGVWQFTDTNAGGFQTRFYRCVMQ